MKSFSRHEIFHWSAGSFGLHIEIEYLLPQRREKTEVPLLAQIFLRNLQFDGLVRLLQSREQWRSRLPHLKINRSILDLNDDVVVELPIQRMKNIVRRSGSIVLRIAPVQMVVLNE